MLKALTLLATIPIVVVSSMDIAFAENVNVKANGGMQKIYEFARMYEGTCNSAPPPTFSVRQQPKNGKLAAQVVKTTVAPDARDCAGRPVHAFFVHYQPNRGFRGRDSAQVTIRYYRWTNLANTVNQTIRLNISVR